jgi:hypothetical protein
LPREAGKRTFVSVQVHLQGLAHATSLHDHCR